MIVGFGRGIQVPVNWLSVNFQGFNRRWVAFIVPHIRSAITTPSVMVMVSVCAQGIQPWHLKQLVVLGMFCSARLSISMFICLCSIIVLYSLSVHNATSILSCFTPYSRVGSAAPCCRAVGTSTGLLSYVAVATVPSLFIAASVKEELADVLSSICWKPFRPTFSQISVCMFACIAQVPATAVQTARTRHHVRNSFLVWG